MKKTKNILLLLLSAVTVFGLSAVCLLHPAQDYSLSERRTLAKKPEVTMESLLSGQFMQKFEDYTLDQFPLRDRFRTLKASALRYVFRQKDNHGLYVQDGYLSKLEYPLNEKNVARSTAKLQEVYNKFIQDTDCKVYLTIVPDKNYFLAPKGGYPTLDYDKLLRTVRKDLSFAEYIHIFPDLQLEDYYYTDQHWRQEKILPVARKLGHAMGVQIEEDYTEHTLDVPLYGAYVGQSALHFDPDTVRYLTNDTLDSCVVTDYDTGKGKPGKLYDMEKAKGKDAYELFLMGANPLLTIENPKADNDRELVVFRDSFGSSITPLLATGYSKVTVIDLRYIRSDMLSYFMAFEKQDVLFLYSTLIFNNTISM